MTQCEWCKQESDRLEELSDWEEHGSFAPRVHEVCPRCVRKHREGFEAAAAEWAAYMEPRYTTRPPTRALSDSSNGSGSRSGRRRLRRRGWQRRQPDRARASEASLRVRRLAFP